MAPHENPGPEARPPRKPEQPGSRKNSEAPQKQSDVPPARRLPPDPEIEEAVRDEFEEAQSRGISGYPGRHRDVPTHTSPEISGGDVDADWTRDDVGEEAVGGTVSTPDQDIVEEIARAAGVVHDDNEPLHTEEKLLERDRHRWELDPASSEDYQERLREEEMMRRKDHADRSGAGEDVGGESEEDEE